jgi:adenosylhomocysteine nucleosidase
VKILITFAVDAEFAPWRQIRNFEKKFSRCLNASAFTAIVGDNEVQVVFTGIGAACCGRTPLQGLFQSDERPDLVISSGFAGALRDTFKPGDVVVPQRARTVNNSFTGDADSGARNAAVHQGASPIETLITVDRIVQTAAEKSRLGLFGAAVDMESALIMSRASEAAVPVVTVRVISDGANEDLPLDFDRCLTPQGAIRPMRLVNAIISGPEKLPKLIRFGRQSNMAAKKLAGFLDNFVASIPARREKVAV